MNYEQNPEDYDPEMREIREFLRENAHKLNEVVPAVDAVFMLHTMIGVWAVNMINAPSKELSIEAWIGHLRKSIIIAAGENEKLLTEFHKRIFSPEPKEWRKH